MEKKVEISVRNFGDAIVGHLARKCKGIADMPFTIQQSSILLDADAPVLVTLSDETARFERSTGKKGKHFFPNGIAFTLSREAVLSALAYEISLYILALPPVKVLEVAPQLPEKIRVRLKYTPNETPVKDSPHCFDGSLSLNE